MRKFLTCRDLVALGYVNNRVTLHRRIEAGQFPAPIRLGARNVAWLKEDIDAWEAARKQERDLALARAR